MTYGIPYMGSKSRIAKRIIDVLPAADTLVDLFAGGCAITHAALLSGKWNNVIANDLGDAPLLFKNATEGLYSNETRWISRDDFFALKDDDPYVRCCWSFGNDQKTYLYGRNIESFKKALHYAVVFKDTSLLKEIGIDVDWAMDIPTVNERRLAICRFLNSKKTMVDYPACEHLQRLQRLQILRGLDKCSISQMDYSEVPIPSGAVVYCDPPYRGTSGYAHTINYDEFYDFCTRCPAPIFISEYDMPEDRFEVIAEWTVPQLKSAKGEGHRVEKLFKPKK